MKLHAPQAMLPRARRRLMMGSFGLVPARGIVGTPGGGSRFLGPPVHPCPQIVQYIPPGCVAKVVTDPVTGCSTRVPDCSAIAPVTTPTPQTPPAIGGTPVPANYPTNQIFVASDGSFWEYSVTAGTWINVGTPYNVNAPAAPAPVAPVTPAPAAAPGVSVSVAPTAAPAPASPYQSVIDFATQDSLITGIPNWVTVAVGFVAGKIALEKIGSKK